jgi:hypothetical protein
MPGSDGTRALAAKRGPAGKGRKAVGVESELKVANRHRLRRIEGRHNSLVKELRQAFDRGELTSTGECAVEGFRIIEEAVRSGLRFRAELRTQAERSPFAAGNGHRKGGPKPFNREQPYAQVDDHRGNGAAPPVRRVPRVTVLAKKIREE